MSEPRQHIALVTVVVDAYDAAISFYCDKLGFNLLEDTPLAEPGKRWVVVSPPGNHGSALLLAQAVDSAQRIHIGNQTGGRVFLFLHTDDFDRDYAAYASRGVRFIEAPRLEPYGKVAIFEDGCGNRWDLLQPADG